MQRRCDRNRKRSKKRAIYCPIHGCYIHSVSQKYSLFADNKRGISPNIDLALEATNSTVSLKREWLEAFWCDDCQETKWYHVQSLGRNVYQVSIAPAKIWQQAVGVTSSDGNPSVSEFSKRYASGCHGKVITYR